MPTKSNNQNPKVVDDQQPSPTSSFETPDNTLLENQLTNDSTLTTSEPNVPMQTDDSQNFMGQVSSGPADVTVPAGIAEKSKKGKFFATILGVVLLVGAVATGVYLVQQQQEIREKASSASECDQHPDCVVFDNPGNEGVREVNRQIVRAVITNQPGNEAEFGQGDHDDGCYIVNIDGNTIHWQKYGSGPDCKDVSNVQVWMGDTPPTVTPTDTPPPSACNESCSTDADCQTGLICSNDVCRNPSCSEETDCSCPGATNTPTSTPTNTPTATATTPPGITAQCLSPKAYDAEWNLLSSGDLSSLVPGDTVRFTVSGTATSGFFDKARFTINGTLRPEVTSKKPGTEEFFDEYTIPEGTTSFTINAQIHHSELGWF